MGEGGHVGAFGEVLAEEAAGVITQLVAPDSRPEAPPCTDQIVVSLQYRPDSPCAARSATLRNEQPGTAHP